MYLTKNDKHVLAVASTTFVICGYIKRYGKKSLITAQHKQVKASKTASLTNNFIAKT